MPPDSKDTFLPADSGSRLIRSFYLLLADDRDSERNQRVERWRARWETTHGRLESKRLVNRAALARGYGLLAEELDLPCLLFAVETYMVLRMGLLTRALFAGWAGTAAVRDFLRALFAPGFFPALGLRGYACDPLFDWFIDPLADADLETVRQEIDSAWAEAGAQASSFPSGDILRGAILARFPAPVRHAMGEFYTPDWLADRLLDGLGYRRSEPGFWEKSLLDPTCGSGVFLCAALRRLLSAVESGSISAQAGLNAALENLAGYDLNPLAVQAAMTNLAVFARAFVRLGAALPAGGADLPVSLRDCLLDPAGRSFDLVAGNPPWVNWEYLPHGYREQIAPLWLEYGLFGQRGIARSLSKEDISGLVLVRAADRFLKDGGKLAFVMPGSILKSSLNGRGLRRFQIGEGGPRLRVLWVDDMSAIRPFKSVANHTTVIFLEKGDQTRYPVPYTVWRDGADAHGEPQPAPVPGGIPAGAAFRVEVHQAAPGDPADPLSSWTSAPPGGLELMERLAGACPYRARTGVFTGGANGVYYLDILQALPGGLVQASNRPGLGRRKAPETVAELEPDFIYPLARGRDVDWWRCGLPGWILCPHTPQTGMRPVPPDQLRADAPLTLAYLERFRDLLLERRGFGGWEKSIQQQTFYALQRIGPYTFLPYKVAWRYIAKRFTCCVIGPQNCREPGPQHCRGLGPQNCRGLGPQNCREPGPQNYSGLGPEISLGCQKPVLPQEKLMYVGCETAEEAYYLCALLSSAPVRAYIESRMIDTQIAPHLIRGLGMPRFDPADTAHMQLSRLCEEGHQARAAGSDSRARSLVLQVDALVPSILPVSAEESALLRRRLETREQPAR